MCCRDLGRLWHTFGRSSLELRADEPPGGGNVMRNCWKSTLLISPLQRYYVRAYLTFWGVEKRCYCMGPASHPVFYRGSRFTQQTLISAFLASIVADLMLKANFFDTNIAAQLAASHLHIETFH